MAHNNLSRVRTLADLSSWKDGNPSRWAGWKIPPNQPFHILDLWKVLVNALKGYAPFLGKLLTSFHGAIFQGDSMLKKDTWISYPKTVRVASLVFRWNLIWNCLYPYYFFHGFWLAINCLLLITLLRAELLAHPAVSFANLASHLFLDCPFVLSMWCLVLSEISPLTSLCSNAWSHLFVEGYSSYPGLLKGKPVIKSPWLLMPRFILYKIMFDKPMQAGQC